MSAPGPTEWTPPDAALNGVGPWHDEHPGESPTDPRFDPELIADGDRRNVVDASLVTRSSCNRKLPLPCVQTTRAAPSPSCPSTCRRQQGMSS